MNLDLILLFIKENFYLICLILIVLVLVLLIVDIFAIVKTNKSSIYNFIKNLIPSAVSLAEQMFGSGHGSQKLDFVVTTVGSYLSKAFPKVTANDYKTYIVNCVEEILATPSKKGVAESGTKKS